MLQLYRTLAPITTTNHRVIITIDPNSQYYYNSHTQQFLYWDAESFSYQPAKVIKTCIFYDQFVCKTF